MHRPTSDSTPGTSGGRTAAVAPNTTSSRPVSRPSSSPHATCTRVFSVSPEERARPVSRAVNPAGTSRQNSRGTTAVRPYASGASNVGSATPASASRHAARAAVVSCAVSQAR